MGMKCRDAKEMETKFTGFQQEYMDLERVNYAIFFFSSAIRKKGIGERRPFPNMREAIDAELCTKKNRLESRR